MWVASKTMGLLWCHYGVCLGIGTINCEEEVRSHGIGEARKTGDEFSAALKNFPAAKFLQSAVNARLACDP